MEPLPHLPAPAKHQTPRLQIALRHQVFEPLEALASWQRDLLQSAPVAQAPLGPAPLESAPLGSAVGELDPLGPAAAAATLAPAESHFIGRVRGYTSAGEPLQALELEHYPGMCERQLEALARHSAECHGVQAVLVIHRVGRLLPGEAIVLVAVAADRRGQAQRCGQELLEALKHEAPFWKREWSGGRGTWIEGNTPLESIACRSASSRERA